MRKLLTILLFTAAFLAPSFAQTNYARMLSGVNAQTGTTYTIQASDVTKVVTFNNGQPTAVTVPSGVISGFGAGTVYSLKNLGAGLVTVTCSCTIFSINGSGSTTLGLTQGQGADLYSDGTNYTAQTGSSSSSAGGPFAGVSTFPAAVTSLNVYGDSISAEYGMPLGQGWAAIAARVLGLPITNNFAVVGARLYQTGFYPSALTQSPSNAVGSMMLGNSNDLGDVPAQTAAIVAGDMAISVYLGLPPTQVKQVINSAISLGGAGWATNNAFGQTNNVAFDSTGGDTATGTVTGTTIYVGGYVAGGYGTGTIKVDGVSQGSVSFLGAVAGGAVFPVAFRYSGFSAGTHTVVLTVTSGFCNIQWMAGNGTVGPYVFFGNTIPRYLQTTQPGILNTAVSAMIGQLQSDGLNIKPIDMNSAIPANPTTVVTSQGDLIHPNFYGHTLLAGKFLDTFTAGSTTLGQLLANLASHEQNLPFGVNGGFSLGWSTNPVFASMCLGSGFSPGSNIVCDTSVNLINHNVLTISDGSSLNSLGWLITQGSKTVQGGNGGSALNTGIATTVLTTITDGTTPWTWTFPGGSHTFQYSCDIQYQASALTTSLVLGVVSSAATGTSTLSNNAHIASTTNGATFTENYQNSTPVAFTSITTLTGAVAGTANANLSAHIWGAIDTGVPSSTLSIQAAASPSGTVLIMRGSSCTGHAQK